MPNPWEQKIEEDKEAARLRQEEENRQRVKLKYILVQMSLRKFMVAKLMTTGLCDNGTWWCFRFDPVEGYEKVSYPVAREKLKELMLAQVP